MKAATVLKNSLLAVAAIKILGRFFQKDPAMRLSQNVRAVSVLAPIADAFAGTVVTDCVNMRHFNNLLFVVEKGVGATGTSTITVEKCSASDGTGAEAIPFRYQRVPNTGVPATAVAAAAAGFATTAGSDETYEIELQGSDLLGTSSKPWVRLKLVEVVDSPVVGSVIAIASGPRYGGSSMALPLAA